MQTKNILAAIALSASALLGSCSGGEEKKNESTEKQVAVIVGASRSGSRDALLSSGQVEAVQTANISTRMMGRITNIFVKAGDKVTKGQLLVTISDEDIRAKKAQTEAMIAEAEAAFASAKKDYDRFSNLFKEQSATARELDNVTLQFQAAKARVEAARQMRSEVNASLAYSSLTAPFSGTVTQKMAEVGNLANPGMPILTIEQSGILQVSASIAESDITHVRLGDTANMEIKSTGKTFTGKIIQLNPSSQFTGGQYIVKISIPAAEKNDILAGMYVNVTIPVTNKPDIRTDAVLIPASALIHRDELTGIYTISSNKTALLRWIRLGKTYGDMVEVISGLSKDESFILSSESKLYNGAPVIVK